MAKTKLKTKIAQENERLRNICRAKDQVINNQQNEINGLRRELGRAARSVRILQRLAEDYSHEGDDAL